jgi:hypothetical protein
VPVLAAAATLDWCAATAALYATMADGSGGNGPEGGSSLSTRTSVEAARGGTACMLSSVEKSVLNSPSTESPEHCPRDRV